MGGSRIHETYLRLRHYSDPDEDMHCVCEGFQLDFLKFFLFCLTLFMTTLGGAAVCFAVSATVRVFAIANLISAFVFTVMMVRQTFLVL